MFGNKQKKEERLRQIGELLKQERNGITQSELARRLGVTRATVLKDLSVLQGKTGILTAEDEHGRIYWFK